MTLAGAFEADPPRPGATEEALVLDLDGYEGPIDVLLALARDQKVDLSRLKILDLVDQYLAFIARARQLRLELAADYLVMAAWLAFLKSRLLLPEPPADESPTGEALAADLAFQLQRLEAMQAAGVRLMARPRLGFDVFARGAPETTVAAKRVLWECTLYDLLKAYGEQRARNEAPTLRIVPTGLHSVEDALKRLSSRLGRIPDWETLASFLPEGLRDGVIARSALASTFAASLELAKTGRLELRQLDHYGPIWLRSGPPG